MEDAHIANGEFMGKNSLFGVFDGHGGREVAVWSRRHYEDVLNKIEDKDDKREWMRQSFLRVDDDLRLDAG